MQITEKQSENIQVLRGLAILAVVFIHNTPVGIAQVYIRPFLNFAVGLFLFLSAFLSNANSWHPKKRILKVIIPYIIWTIIYVVFHNYKNPYIIPLEIIKNLITARSAAVMYYIFVYCELTLLIPLIDKLARSKYKYIGFLVTPVEIVIMRLIPLIRGMKTNTYIDIIVGISCIGWFSYYYFGYLIGNSILDIRIGYKKLIFFWTISIVFQILEGYWYFAIGQENCGTQLKLSSVLSGMIFVIIAYKFLNSNKWDNMKILRVLGDNSFGIFFSHLAIMAVIKHITIYNKYVFYPVNAIVVVFISLFFVTAGKKVLGKYSKYLAF